MLLQDRLFAPPVTQSEASRLKINATVASVVVQAVATAYFVADAIADIVLDRATPLGVYHVVELGIALALTAGVVSGYAYFQMLRREAKRHEDALAIVRGAMNETVNAQFAAWHLTAAEREVALFAIKGCDIAEISRLRDAAAGTVRAQLSRIYTKAGVTGQTGLMSHFLEDLLDLGSAANAG